MSGVVRRLNYTKRKRIKHQDVVVTIHRPVSLGFPVVTLSIDLSSYELPVDARVLLEAYRHSSWQRFDFGTAGAIQAPNDRSLVDFGDAEGVQFRVKIVEACSDGPVASRILAQADGIKASVDGPRRSLLPMDPDPNLFDEIWRLELDENDGPLVKISTALVRDRHTLARSSPFLSLVMPEILRKSLSWAIHDGLPSDEDWDTPRGRWIRFGCALQSQSEPPENLDSDDEARDKWVEDGVARFCRANRLSEVFGNWWRDDASLPMGVSR